MAKPSTLYAEDMNYWQSGKSSPDTWIDNAKKEIIAVGGKIHGWAFGSEDSTHRAAYMLEFELQGERFKLVWPVLPTRTGKESAARIQAATCLYHDVKARCITARVLGGRSAFFSYLMLPDGRTAANVAIPDLESQLPALFAPKLLTDNQNKGGN